MHFEVPKTRLHSLRDFAQHYFMIVLSILTALGLEQWIEHVHHRHAADYASAQIDAELAGMLHDIQDSLQTDEAKLAPLVALDKAISDDVAKGLPDAQINQHIRQLKRNFKISTYWPAFSTQAWDVAVANQSAAWIDVDRLHRYTAAYAAARGAADWTTHNATQMLDAPRMVDMQTRIWLDKDVDPVAFLCVTEQMIASSKGLIANLQDATKPVKAALAHGGK